MSSNTDNSIEIHDMQRGGHPIDQNQERNRSTTPRRGGAPVGDGQGYRQYNGEADNGTTNTDNSRRHRPQNIIIPPRNNGQDEIITADRQRWPLDLIEQRLNNLEGTTNQNNTNLYQQ